MRLRLLLFATLLLVAGPPGAHPATAEPRVALVIGNSAYSGVRPLQNPVNDARAMDQALRGFGFEVIRLENASKSQIEAGLAQLTQRLTPDAVGLVYYAGHGVQIGGRNYLIPVDVRIDSEAALAAQSIDVDRVIERIASRHGRLSVIILDACRDNPFRPAQHEALAGGAGPRIAPAAPADPRLRGVSGGLAPIDAPSGILIAYATAPGMVAADGEGANGLYTAELIRAMSMPGSGIEFVLKKTRRAVMQQSGGAQIPWESSSLTANFVFRPPAADGGSVRLHDTLDYYEIACADSKVFLAPDLKCFFSSRPIGDGCATYRYSTQGTFGKYTTVLRLKYVTPPAAGCAMQEHTPSGIVAQRIAILAHPHEVGDYAVVPFTAGEFSCLSFTQNSDPESVSRGGRRNLFQGVRNQYFKAIFGYLCQPGAAPLSDAEFAAVARSFQIRL